MLELELVYRRIKKWFETTKDKTGKSSPYDHTDSAVT